jgi:hypothetical protein
MLKRSKTNALRTHTYKSERLFGPAPANNIPGRHPAIESSCLPEASRQGLAGEFLKDTQSYNQIFLFERYITPTPILLSINNTSNIKPRMDRQMIDQSTGIHKIASVLIFKKLSSLSLSQTLLFDVARLQSIDDKTIKMEATKKTSSSKKSSEYRESRLCWNQGLSVSSMQIQEYFALLRRPIFFVVGVRLDSRTVWLGILVLAECWILWPMTMW